jgi:glycerol-3-phosphate dehydrogenase (NAD(P)+)
MHRQIGQVVEGVNTAREIIRLAEKHQVEMPICEQVCQVVHEGRDPRQAAAELLARDQKSERV